MNRRLSVVLQWAVVLCIVVCVLWSYRDAAWRSTRFGSFDRHRCRLLEALWTGGRAYWDETGQWPGDMNALVGHAHLGDEAVTPSDLRDIVYYLPPTRDGTVLRSYGHKEWRPGWNLKYDPASVAIDVDGELLFEDSSTSPPRPIPRQR